MINLLVLAPCDDDQKAMLREATAGVYDITFAYNGVKDTRSAQVQTELQEELQNLINRADVIIGEPSIEQIKQSERLKWIQMTWAGTDIYTRRPGFPEQVKVTTASGAFGGIISEYVVGAILMQYRRFIEYHKNQKAGVWKDVGSERSLDGKNVLILGTGDIGVNIAKRLEAFGTYNIGIRRNAGKMVEHFDEVHTLSELDGLLPQADIIIGCLPNTDETIGLLNEKRLLSMKEDALLINVGRGSLIDTGALIRVLQQGHLSGVVLDVLDQEPLPEESHLWSMEQVMITPHISGISFGHEKKTEKKIWKICCENLKQYAEDGRLKNLVDFTTGYRSK